MKEGQDEHVAINAKRVAYSCYGKIRSLSGEAEKSVLVEAVSSSGEVEEVSWTKANSKRELCFFIFQANLLLLDPN